MWSPVLFVMVCGLRIAIWSSRASPQSLGVLDILSSLTSFSAAASRGFLLLLRDIRVPHNWGLGFGKCIGAMQPRCCPPSAPGPIRYSVSDLVSSCRLSNTWCMARHQQHRIFSCCESWRSAPKLGGNIPPSLCATHVKLHPRTCCYSRACVCDRKPRLGRVPGHRNRVLYRYTPPPPGTKVTIKTNLMVFV